MSYACVWVINHLLFVIFRCSTAEKKQEKFAIFYQWAGKMSCSEEVSSKRNQHVSGYMGNKNKNEHHISITWCRFVCMAHHIWWLSNPAVEFFSALQTLITLYNVCRTILMMFYCNDQFLMLTRHIVDVSKRLSIVWEHFTKNKVECKLCKAERSLHGSVTAVHEH